MLVTVRCLVLLLCLSGGEVLVRAVNPGESPGETDSPGDTAGDAGMTTPEMEDKAGPRTTETAAVVTGEAGIGRDGNKNNGSRSENSTADGRKEEGTASPTAVNNSVGKEALPTIPCKPMSYEEVEKLEGPWSCDSEVFCKGPLLDAVQRRKIFPDAKTFVDMSLKEDQTVVLQAFKELKERGPYSDKELKELVEKHFTGPGDELEDWEPPDWTKEPEVLKKVKDETLRMWLRDLNDLWKTLGRRIKDKVRIHPDRYSIVDVPNGFIAPGDRFREFYYWDSYWIVNGLLLSGMMNTSRGVLENMLEVVNRYGFVLNGGRRYYECRSQPPLLISMVDSYYEATKDLEFIQKSFSLLEKEHDFWIKNRTVSINKDGKLHQLAVYKVDLGHPRPEGYFEDLLVPKDMKPGEAEATYSAIASAAESGWDFSSRWFTWSGPDKMNMRGIKTPKIVPVDLNTFLFFSEQLLAKFADLIDQKDKTVEYQAQAETRLESMQAIMWDEHDGIWYDYDLSMNQPRRKFYPSNIFPLMIFPNNTKVADKVVSYLEREGVLSYPGGVPTSTVNTGQQWDFPSAWAPLIYFMTTALGNSASARAQDMAFNMSRTWVFSNLDAWHRTGVMYEKYSVEKSGLAGGGGEYSVQVGFGWTNGVIFQLMDRYGDVLHVPPSLRHESYPRPRRHTDQDKLLFVLVPVAVFIIAVLIFVCLMKRKVVRRARRGPLSTSGLTAAHFHKIS